MMWYVLLVFSFNSQFRRRETTSAIVAVRIPLNNTTQVCPGMCACPYVLIAFCFSNLHVQTFTFAVDYTVLNYQHQSEKSFFAETRGRKCQFVIKSYPCNYLFHNKTRRASATNFKRWSFLCGQLGQKHIVHRELLCKLIVMVLSVCLFVFFKWEY